MQFLFREYPSPVYSYHALLTYVYHLDDVWSTATTARHLSVIPRKGELNKSVCISINPYPANVENRVSS